MLVFLFALFCLSMGNDNMRLRWMLTDIGDVQAIQRLAERGEPLARKLIQKGSLDDQEATSLKQELYTHASKSVSEGSAILFRTVVSYPSFPF